MNIGFHASSDHAPNRTLLRALWTHAPSSCQTTPTLGFHGGSAAGKINRRPRAIDRDGQERHDVAAPDAVVDRLDHERPSLRTQTSKASGPPVRM